MIFKLRDFQTEAVNELAKKLKTARRIYREDGENSAIGLTAVTGAGKTIIATALIERLIFGSDEVEGAPGDPGAVFLWMTDLPQLNEQTQGKMLDAGSRLTLDRLPIIENTFNQETLAGGRIYFLNTQLLGEKTRLVAPDPTVSRPFTFWETVTKTIEAKDRTLYLVVDEAHRGMNEGKKIEDANSIIQRFIKGIPGVMPPVPIVFGISATPEPFDELMAGTTRNRSTWPVPPEKVRASGLIKERTAADYAKEKQRDAMALFRDAVTAWKDSTDQWAAYHEAYSGPTGDDRLVVPALIVQVENVIGGKVTQTPMEAVLKVITEIAGPLPDSAFAHAFGEKGDLSFNGRIVRYLEPHKIAGDTESRVIFFKTSLGTGWDCPRAEVMFSFRRAVDPTSIAQTIGRMVRTPLARKIEEDDRLNSVDVFLPHYDQRAVKRVIAYLRASGGAAIADSIEDRAALMDLPLRAGSEKLVAAIERVPTYVVPTIKARPAVHRLVDLTRSLAKHELDLDASMDETAHLADILLARRAALETNPDFQKAIGESGEITVGRMFFDWLDVDSDAEPATTVTRNIPASEESISRLWGAAKSRLSAELAFAYSKARIAGDPMVSFDVVRLEAAALAGWPGVMAALNDAASPRIDELWVTYDQAIDGLAPSKQKTYKDLRGNADKPSLVPLKLPEFIQFRFGTDLWAKHVYADLAGNIPLSFKSSWEKATLDEELPRPEVVGWLRNTPGDSGSLCVPWLKDNAWHPFYPDFLIVRAEGDRLVVDILDPHDSDRPDAVEKAKGLSTYAREHHGDAFGHIDLIAKVDGVYHRIHLEREQVRKAVDRISGNDALKLLYKYGDEGARLTRRASPGASGND